jgi:hypothetical protein
MRICAYPNFLRLDRDLSAPQLDLSACADRKMVILYVYLRIWTTKTQLYRTDVQIKKLRWCKKENLCTQSYMYLRICIFSKELTA